MVVFLLLSLETRLNRVPSIHHYKHGRCPFGFPEHFAIFGVLNFPEPRSSPKPPAPRGSSQARAIGSCQWTTPATSGRCRAGNQSASRRVSSLHRGARGLTWNLAHGPGHSGILATKHRPRRASHGLAQRGSKTHSLHAGPYLAYVDSKVFEKCTSLRAPCHALVKSSSVTCKHHVMGASRMRQPPVFFLASADGFDWFSS